MDNLKEFGIFLAKMREKSGFKSQRQLTLVSGISSATLSRIEAGTQRPQPDTLKTLSKHLKDVTYEELMKKAGYFEVLELMHGEYITPEFKQKMEGFVDDVNAKLPEKLPENKADQAIDMFRNMSQEQIISLNLPILINLIDGFKKKYGEDVDALHEILNNLNSLKAKRSYSDETKEFLSSLDLADEEIMKSFPLEIDGRLVTEDEYKWFIASVRAKRMMEDS